MYKIIDLQGSGFFGNEMFDSKKEIYQRLVDFHSVDVEGVEKMSLEEICSIGCWDIEKIYAKT